MDLLPVQYMCIVLLIVLLSGEMSRDEGGGGPEAGDSPFPPRIHRRMYEDPQ